MIYLLKQTCFLNLSPHLKRVFEVASERGASCWLTALPVAEHGFALPKSEFRDALCLRFGWKPVNLPQTCVCVVNLFQCKYLAVRVADFHLCATMTFVT